MSEKQSNDSRRKLLKSIAVGSGAVVAGKTMPEAWTKPVVNSVMLPAHAATTGEDGSLPTEPPTTPVPACVRIEFQFPYDGSGNGTPITQVNFPANHDALDGEEPDAGQSYVTAWGYFPDAPTTPVAINVEVVWSSSNTSVAHTGSGPGVFAQQASSSITTYDTAGQSAVITATYIDLKSGCHVSASYTVNVVAT